MQDVFACATARVGSTLTVRLTGEFDLMGVGRVEAAIDPLPDGVTRVVLDLSDLDFLDASGLGTVLRAADRADQGEFELLVIRPRGSANRVFTVTRTDRRLKMLESAPAA
jgi:anti-anti-sigma factor